MASKLRGSVTSDRGEASKTSSHAITVQANTKDINIAVVMTTEGASLRITEVEQITPQGAVVSHDGFDLHLNNDTLRRLARGELIVALV